MADLTYKQLQQAVADLAKEVTRTAEAIRSRGQQINDEATDTARVAEHISRLNVDSETVAETRELAKMFAGVSEAAIAYASAGDNTAKAAQAAGEQAKESHGGIHEAVSRSGVNGIHNVKREWFTQE